MVFMPGRVAQSVERLTFKRQRSRGRYPARPYTFVFLSAEEGQLSVTSESMSTY